MLEIDKLIEQWQDRHHEILCEYSKGNVSNEVMQMYRRHLKDLLSFINTLKEIKNANTKIN